MKRRSMKDLIIENVMDNNSLAFNFHLVQLTFELVDGFFSLRERIDESRVLLKGKGGDEMKELTDYAEGHLVDLWISTVVLFGAIGYRQVFDRKRIKRLAKKSARYARYARMKGKASGDSGEKLKGWRYAGKRWRFMGSCLGDLVNLIREGVFYSCPVDSKKIAIALSMFALSLCLFSDEDSELSSAEEIWEKYVYRTNAGV